MLCVHVNTAAPIDLARPELDEVERPRRYALLGGCLQGMECALASGIKIAMFFIRGCIITPFISMTNGEAETGHSFQRRKMMRLLVTVTWLLLGARGIAQTDIVVNSGPNPYRTIDNWARLPQGVVVGQAAGVDVDPNGNVWVAQRCGSNTCNGRNDAPILQFN